MPVTNSQLDFLNSLEKHLSDEGSIGTNVIDLGEGEEPETPADVVEEKVEEWESEETEAITNILDQEELSQEEKDGLIKAFNRFINFKKNIAQNTSSYTYNDLRSNSVYIMCEKDSWMDDLRKTFLARAMYRNTYRSQGGNNLTFYGYSNGDKRRAVGKKKSEKAYKVAVQFFPNDIEKNLHGKTNLDTYLELADKRRYKPNLIKDFVKATCSCNSFYFYNSHANSHYGCKFGKSPINYKATSDRVLNLNNKTTTYGTKGAQSGKKGSHVSSTEDLYGPGLCKHLVNFIEDFLLGNHLVSKPMSFVNQGKLHVHKAKEVSKEIIDGLNEQIKIFKEDVAKVRTLEDYDKFMEAFKYVFDYKQ